MLEGLSYLHQPQQFTFVTAQSTQYTFDVIAEENPTEFSVANILLKHYNIGDVVEVTAPLSR